MEHKIEVKTPEESKEEKKIKGKKREYSKGENKEEPIDYSSILTTSNKSYTKEMLLERLHQVGLLDDYLEGRKVERQTVRWIEFFPKEDILQIFANFPEVYERCNNLIEKKVGPSILTIFLFDDTFCNLFEKVLKAAKEIHLKHGWGLGFNTEEFHQFEFAIFLLNTYLDEDYRFAGKQKERSILKALDKFAETDFVNLENFGQPISSQLHNIIKKERCSAGFTEQLSRIYTALTLTRTLIYYQKQLEGNVREKTEEKSSSPAVVTWNYQQASLFFKPKKELQQEMINPLYHGDIDTSTAKNILSNSGEYLARYSLQQQNHYLTILLDINASGGKNVLNFIIPAEKVETWMQKPLENREEIEFFIKNKLINIKENHKGTPEQAAVIRFLEHEQYSPVFNQVSNSDILTATPK